MEPYYSLDDLQWLKIEASMFEGMLSMFHMLAVATYKKHAVWGVAMIITMAYSS